MSAPASHVPGSTPASRVHLVLQYAQDDAAKKANEVIINVYDLLPPGRFPSFLWRIGAPLLHSGVVVNGREYAYGGHAEQGVSGVYWVLPRTEPPGGKFRCELLHGFTTLSVEDVDKVVRETSHKFHGPARNLLSNNCNHFTSHLCQQLTGKPAPSWLNRAAHVGLAVPSIARKIPLSAPDLEGADGEPLDERYSYNGAEILESIDQALAATEHMHITLDEEEPSRRRRSRARRKASRAKARFCRICHLRHRRHYLDAYMNAYTAPIARRQ